jgi:polysaccharide biosynthesis/export protein
MNTSRVAAWSSVAAAFALTASLHAQGSAQKTQPQPVPQQKTQPQPAPQQRTPAPAQPLPTSTARPAVTGPVVDVGGDYIIGPEDVIGVLFFKEPDMTGDHTVRPDGKISLPLVGEVMASGVRPDVLAGSLQKAAGKFLTDPTVTVVVRQINSRKIFVTGEVRTPGAFPLIGPRTVLQAIALAGGLNEYAKRDDINIVRTDARGQTRTFKFNYKEVSEGRRLEQNIQLQPGDTVIVR